MGIIKTILKSVLNAFFPNRCYGCNAIIPFDEGFCDYCSEELPKTARDSLCEICCCPKPKCQCSYHVFHFSGMAAPFYNENPAKRAMYSLKFNKRLYIADFFARQMALCVKTRFYDVCFDTVVCVPMPAKRQLKRGYNQSRELALRIAKILNIPFAENALGCDSTKKTQHTVSFKERFQNVKGKYFANFSLSGRTVLLVDDIKTTGATLNECAKQLLAAGADRVYCVTGLVTRYEEKDKLKKVDNYGN
ncbi:MAG: ComF family protein [Acutalibacteraceae bacterium]|jgi:competence protein ComFC